MRDYIVIEKIKKLIEGITPDTQVSIVTTQRPGYKRVAVSVANDVTLEYDGHHTIIANVMMTDTVDVRYIPVPPGVDGYWAIKKIYDYAERIILG